MTRVLLLTAILLATKVYGQVPPQSNPALTPLRISAIPDTALKVVYSNKAIHKQNTALFLNGKLVNESMISTLKPNMIDSLDVIKGFIEIDNIQYDGQLRIKTKSGYMQKLISLVDLKAKHTNLKNTPAMFMIDGNIVNGDYDTYMIDESSLLTIKVDKVENPKENIDMIVINLLTRSAENIRKQGGIRIRGSAVSLTR